MDEVVDDPEDTDYNPDETEGTPSKKRRRNDELPDPNQVCSEPPAFFPNKPCPKMFTSSIFLTTPTFPLHPYPFPP